MCKYYGIPKSEKWYKHLPEPITEAKGATILSMNNRSNIMVKD